MVHCLHWFTTKEVIVHQWWALLKHGGFACLGWCSARDLFFGIYIIIVVVIIIVTIFTILHYYTLLLTFSVPFQQRLLFQCSQPFRLLYLLLLFFQILFIIMFLPQPNILLHCQKLFKLTYILLTQIINHILLNLLYLIFW